MPPVSMGARVYISSAAADQAMRLELEKHLAVPLQRGALTLVQALEQANLVLALISPDYVSNAALQDEAWRAAARSAAGIARVVPVLLRPVEWRGSCLAPFKALPSDGRPISAWGDPDDARVAVVADLLTVLVNLPSTPPRAVVAARRRGRVQLILLVGGAALCGDASPLPETVRLEGGALLMGTTPDEVDVELRACRQLSSVCRREVFAREAPLREVQVQSLFIDRTEVTNHQFAAWLNSQPGLIVKEGGRLVEDAQGLLVDLHPTFSGLQYVGPAFRTRGAMGRLPVVQVTWRAAQRYCEARGMRLPSEVEWERAARGFARRRFPWGAEEPDCAGTIFGRSAGGRCGGLGSGPAPVGSAPRDRSPEGVADLAGNVAEWVADAPSGAAGQRVIRGGDFAEGPAVCRAAGKTRRPAEEALFNVGFRCARAAQVRP